MASAGHHTSIRAVTDGDDRLLEADEPLAQLQLRCGGVLPGTVSVPELFEMVQQSRSKGLKLAREFQAFDGNEAISGFARVSPIRGDGESGCELLIENWRQENYPELDEQELSDRLDTIDRMMAEMTVRLDRDLLVLTADPVAPDLTECAKAMTVKSRAMWSDFVTLTEDEYKQPLHWRLIDGAKATVDGSAREWRMRLMPLGGPSENPDGFELLLLSDQPLLTATSEAEQNDAEDTALVGGVLSRVLRHPIGRIISNAETIRARLAGPLRAEYTNYAGDIASAGSHLLALLEDLADLEDVESSEFETADDTVDLADVATRAATILSGKSQAKQIAVEFAVDAADADAVIAKAEFRRVLQILINVLGNAINYSPEGSMITVTIAAVRSVGASGQGYDQALVIVADQGEGLTAEQQVRVFTKYERLGREGDGGSGLGLYISQRLARAMDGDLTVHSKPGEGATFTLVLPGAG